LRGLSFAGLSVAVPIVSAAAMARQVAPPPFAQVVGRKLDRVAEPLPLIFGILLLALTVLTVQSVLSLAFDPRYRDFPFAPLTAAALPLLLVSFLVRPAAGRRALAETLAGGVLAPCAIFIVWNETLANWQALWFAAAVVAVTISLLRARVAPD
jgi:glucan 1,3-beta-glucosidase